MISVAHGCQPTSDGASSLDLPWLGILDCCGDRGDREVARVEVTGAELCGVSDTVYGAEAEKSAGNGGGARTNVGIGACNDDGARVEFSIVSMSWGSTQLRGVGFKV